MEEENNNILPPEGAGGEVGFSECDVGAILSPDADLQQGAEGRDGSMTELLSQLQKEKDALQAEVTALRAAEAVYREKEAKQAQWEELYALYPDLDPRTLPKEVVEQTELPLVAAYALYCRRQALSQAAAQAVNEQNVQTSPGAVRHDGESDTDYTYDEIRQMSSEALHRNYASVLRSLKSTRKKR